MNWLIENKEWVFSGGGIAIISALMFFFKKEKPIADSTAIQNRDNNGQQANNNGNNNTQIFQQFGTVMPIENKPKSSENDALDFSQLKSKTRVLFIDDNDFPVVKNLKKAGWITDLINDVYDIDDASIVASHILFVDINGVAKSLSDEEGVGLVKALKKKYGKTKKVIIYSSDEEGNRFNEAFRVADDFLPKQSDYFEFLAIVEKYAKEVFGN